MEITKTHEFDFEKIKQIVNADKEISDLFGEMRHITVRAIPERPNCPKDEAIFVTVTDNANDVKTEVNLTLGEVKKLVARSLSGTNVLVKETHKSRHAGDGASGSTVNGLRATVTTTRVLGLNPQ